jgi:aminoglycoside phosphotransferase family enzyme
MTKEQIQQLISEGEFPDNTTRPDLIETHISWVILTEEFVYKIKKPVYYSFLDFSTMEKRKYYCEKEIVLNRRLSDDIYLAVVTVKEDSGKLIIDGNHGKTIDHAVKMRKQDRSKQMDVLLTNNKVTPSDIQSLAKKIASFHENAVIITNKDVLDIREKFNDLETQTEYLRQNLNNNHSIISHAIAASNAFLEKKRQVLDNRLKAGFFRDCHGDLHSRNIFLLPKPKPFDCIEFNDDYRQIDVLNEIAFLCMDLDAFGREDLSDLFLKYYNHLFYSMQSEEDHQLFIYYKAYRANIRAKINSLRARGASNESERNLQLAEVGKYLKLMDSYMKSLRL